MPQELDWRVVRCPYEHKAQTERELNKQGYEVHDSFFSNSSATSEMEEFTIIVTKLVEKEESNV